jgi:hypothetical protein
VTGGWRAVLDGVMMSGSIETPGDGILTAPPDGLGAPALTTHDVALIQRDGVQHFDDWYTPRLITLQGAVGGDQCTRVQARAAAKRIINAWSRRCDDAELVIFTDAHGESADLSIVGPFSAIGRPRVASVVWQPGNAAVGLLTLRFDALDHRLYVLDPDGTPGSGGTTIELFVAETYRTYDRAYSWQYDQSGGGNVAASEITGDLCVYPTVTVFGPFASGVLTLTEQVSGQQLTFAGGVAQGDWVTINTAEGTAYTSNGTNVSQNLAGTGPFQLQPGAVSFLADGDGEGRVEVFWRPMVLSA